MNRTARLLTALAAAGLLALTACGGDPAPPDQPSDPGADAGDGMTGDDMPGDAPDAGAEDPAEVPDSLAFTGTTVDGEQFDGADYAGEPVVLWFWAHNCPVCRGQAGDVMGVTDQVTVIGVSRPGDSNSQNQQFISDTGTGAMTHFEDADGELWRKFGVTYQHTFALIDADGENVHTGNLSSDELRDRVRELTS